MIDISFYMKIHSLNKRLLNGEKIKNELLQAEFEKLRNKTPVVYNIETTNACNMRCKMCPRTTMMTRKVDTLNIIDFTNIITQLRPWTAVEWNTWKSFVIDNYGIMENEMSENHFFLYIIPKVIQLHGYGDPLLDKNMPEIIRVLSQKGFYSYFSCNPANIHIDKTIEMFENGLDYIKYSIESVDDERHKKIRGGASNFTQSYENILKLLELKKQRNFKTTIVITMLDLNHEWQEEEYTKLRKAFEDRDVYIYMKSEDQQWHRQDFHETKSIHWSELCKHPWMSMTIKSNAEAVMCMEDFNNEIILGNVRETLLIDIWNGEKYWEFRKNHFNNKKRIKCTEECDMRIVGDCI